MVTHVTSTSQVALALLVPAALAAQAPVIDYHQHLFSPAASALVTGKPDAQGINAKTVFLETVLPGAPDVPVQIAHLAGSGGYDATIDSALSVFTDAIARQDPRLKNVWFDACVIVRPDMPAVQRQLVANRIRQLGVGRVLYGSDAAVSPVSYPKAGWAAFRKLPLSEAEFATIAGNVTPYMR